jgi:hypothetical protein
MQKLQHLVFLTDAGRPGCADGQIHSKDEFGRKTDAILQLREAGELRAAIGELTESSDS